MDIGEWLSEQEQQGSAQHAAEAERQARELAEAERIIAGLEDELRSVVPHLAAFPRVSVGEQRVEIDSATRTAEVVDVGPATDAWVFPTVARSQPRYWVDVHGRLWHQAFALITFEGPPPMFSLPKPRATASVFVCLPFNVGMVRQQWQARGTRDITMDVRVDGERVTPGSTLADAGHAESELVERRQMNFFDVGSVSSAPAGSLDGQQRIGWATYDSHPTLVHDDVYRRVKAALDAGTPAL